MAGLKAARTALAAEITAAIAASPVDPAGSVDVLPWDDAAVVAPAVTVATAGVNALAWRLYVRIYVDAGQSQQDADLLDDLTEAIDLGLGDTTGRSSWEWQYDDLKGLFLMITTVDYPREDM